MNLNGYNLINDRYAELDKVKVLIGIPHNHIHEYTQFRTRLDVVKSFIEGEWRSYLSGYHLNQRNSWALSWQSGYDIEDMRNQLVSNLLLNKYDFLLQIDSDMDMFPIDLPYVMLDKMLKYNIDILSAVCFCRHPVEMESKLDAFYPAVFKKYDNGQILGWDQFRLFSGILSKDILTGGACTMIKSDVFRDIEFPWYKKEKIYNEHQLLQVTSEDIYFCKKAIEKGYKIHLDTDMPIAHIADGIKLPYELYNQYSGLSKDFLDVYTDFLKNQINKEVING